MNKKKIIISSISTIMACSLLAYPIFATIQSVSSTVKQHKAGYEFLNQKFANKQDAINYANNLTIFNSSNVNTPVSWSLNVGNKIINFQSPSEIIDYLNKYIDTKEYTTYKNNIETNSDGSIVVDEIKNMNFTDSNPVPIYRGKNNTIHTSLQSAQDSYLNIHEVYYFDNLFFRSKEELSIYLEKKFSSPSSTKNVESIVIKNKNGEVSLPINLSDIKNIDDPNSKTRDYINDFVINNTDPYFELVDSANIKHYFNKNNVNEIQNSYNPNFVKLMSNQGKGNYIVDLDKEDEYTLYGPYYVKSEASIEMMTDPDNWRKSEGIDNQFISNALVNEKVTNFFNSLVYEDEIEDKIFTYSPIQSDIDAYFSELNEEFPQIYNSIFEISTTMKKGKRYSQFLKLPILFVHTIDQLVFYRAPQKYIDKTREIYTKITQYFDEKMKYSIPRDLLIGVDGTIFSFENLFGINNFSLDLNYDVETLVSIIEKKYPQLMRTIDFIGYCLVLFNSNPTYTSEDFNKNILNDLFNFVINDDEYYSFKMIWDVLTTEKGTSNYENNILKILQTHNKDINSTEDIQEKSPTFYSETFINRQNINTILTNLYDAYFRNNTQNLNPELNMVFLKNLFEIDSDLRNLEYIRDVVNKNDELNIKQITLLLILDKLTYQKLDILLKDIDVNDYNALYAKFLDIYKKQKNELADIKILNLTSMNLGSLSNLFLNTNYINDDTHKYKGHLKEYYNQEHEGDRIISEKISIFLNKVVDWNEAKNNFKLMLRDISKKVGEMVKCMKIASAVFPFISIALDVFFNFFKEKYYSYIFENEDVKYIWNGGYEQEFFFGLFNNPKRDASAMKLLKPMEIIKPNVENTYYYNGKTYDTEDQLKTVQLNDILIGKYDNDIGLNKVYSMYDLTKNNNINPEFVADSITELQTKTTEHIKRVTNNGNDCSNVDSQLVSPSSYKYGSNYSFDSNYSIAENINRIISDIQPTLLVQTPVLCTGNEKYIHTPIFSDVDNGDDGSIKPYNLPLNSWTNGAINYNDDNNFIILDPNQEKRMSEKESKNIIKSQFYNSFNVDSKIVDSKFVNSTTLYSEISENIEHKQLFIAHNIYNEEKYFLSKYDALKWLYANFEFRAYYTKEQYQTIYFNDMVFNSYADYQNWLEKNIKEI